MHPALIPFLKSSRLEQPSMAQVPWNYAVRVISLSFTFDDRAGRIVKRGPR